LYFYHSMLKIGVVSQDLTLQNGIQRWKTSRKEGMHITRAFFSLQVMNGKAKSVILYKPLYYTLGRTTKQKPWNEIENTRKKIPAHTNVHIISFSP
jgi:hypothetical protein